MLIPHRVPGCWEQPVTSVTPDLTEFSVAESESAQATTARGSRERERTE